MRKFSQIGKSWHGGINKSNGPFEMDSYFGLISPCQDVPIFLIFFWTLPDYKLSIAHSPSPLDNGGT